METGSPEWLIDVMKGLMKGNLDHTCHQTDKKADLYVGIKKERPCYGFLGVLKRDGQYGVGNKAIKAIARGEIDWGKLPTKGIFPTMADAIRYHGESVGIQMPAKPWRGSSEK